METADLRCALEKAGLSQYQTDAYTTLLRLGFASVTEVSTARDVPTARIYDVHQGLEDRGYVETYDQEKLDTVRTGKPVRGPGGDDAVTTMTTGLSGNPDAKRYFHMPSRGIKNVYTSRTDYE